MSNKLTVYLVPKERKVPLEVDFKTMKVTRIEQTYNEKKTEVTIEAGKNDYGSALTIKITYDQTEPDQLEQLDALVKFTQDSFR